MLLNNIVYPGTRLNHIFSQKTNHISSQKTLSNELCSRKCYKNYREIVTVEMSAKVQSDIDPFFSIPKILSIRSSLCYHWKAFLKTSCLVIFWALHQLKMKINTSNLTKQLRRVSFR